MSAPLNPTPYEPGIIRARPAISRGWRLTGMIAATFVCLGMAALGAVWAIFSPLVFDHAGNLLNPLAWVGFLLMITFWIICVLGPFAAWVAWSRRQEPLAWAAMCAPVAWAVLMATVLQFVPK